MAGFRRTLPRMTQVRVRAALPLAWLRMGVDVLVDETDDVKTAIADGKLVVLERVPDTHVPGEYDATHGEADPEPGDPDFDEYSRDFDEKLPAPLPPKPRKGSKA